VGNVNEQLTAALKRREQLDAEIRALKERERQEQQKLDDKKALLIGRLVLKESRKNADLAATVQRLVEQGLTAARDRILFDLPAVPPKASAAKPASKRSPTKAEEGDAAVSTDDA
jgi:hypothetical protein